MAGQILHQPSAEHERGGFCRLAKRRAVPAHTRRVVTRDCADDGESLTFFDESRVPSRSSRLDQPEAGGKNPNQDEVIGEEITYRLNQNPGRYEVLKLYRPVVKIN